MTVYALNGLGRIGNEIGYAHRLVDVALMVGARA